MKNSLIILLVIALVGCKPIRTIPVLEVRDTIISVKSDTAYLTIQVDCDSTYTPVFTNLEIQQGERSHITPQITKNNKSNQVKIESVSEELKTPVERVYVKETEYVNKPIPKFYTFCLIWFILTLCIICIKICIIIRKFV